MSPEADAPAGGGRSGIVHVARHADALDRRGWHRSDGERPLTATGFAQSRVLAGRYRGLARLRIVSSPAVRCVQTVEPVAEGGGWPVELVGYLAEGAGGAAARAGLLKALPGGVDQPAPAGGQCPDVLACTHGDVLGELLALLLEHGVALAGPARTPKSGTVELVVEHGAFRAARYLAPPVIEPGTRPRR